MRIILTASAALGLALAAYIGMIISFERSNDIIDRLHETDDRLNVLATDFPDPSDLFECIERHIHEDGSASYVPSKTGKSCTAQNTTTLSSGNSWSAAASGSDGSVHVSDHGTDKIIDKDGDKVSENTRSGGRFGSPYSMCWDSSGRYMFVVDRDEHIVGRFDHNTKKTTIIMGTAGTPGFGKKANAEGTGPVTSTKSSDYLLYSPTDCALDKSENLYIADSGNNQIVKIAAVGGGGTAPDGSTAASVYGSAGNTGPNTLGIGFGGPYRLLYKSTAIVLFQEDVMYVVGEQATLVAALVNVSSTTPDANTKNSKTYYVMGSGDVPEVVENSIPESSTADLSVAPHPGFCTDITSDPSGGEVDFLLACRREKKPDSAGYVLKVSVTGNSILPTTIVPGTMTGTVQRIWGDPASAVFDNNLYISKQPTYTTKFPNIQALGQYNTSRIFVSLGESNTVNGSSLGYGLYYGDTATNANNGNITYIGGAREFARRATTVTLGANRFLGTTMSIRTARKRPGTSNALYVAAPNDGQLFQLHIRSKKYEMSNIAGSTGFNRRNMVSAVAFAADSDGTKRDFCTGAHVRLTTSQLVDNSRWRICTHASDSRVYKHDSTKAQWVHMAGNCTNDTSKADAYIGGGKKATVTCIGKVEGVYATTDDGFLMAVRVDAAGNGGKIVHVDKDGDITVMVNADDKSASDIPSKCVNETGNATARLAVEPTDVVVNSATKETFWVDYGEGFRNLHKIDNTVPALSNTDTILHGNFPRCNKEKDSLNDELSSLMPASASLRLHTSENSKKQVLIEVWYYRNWCHHGICIPSISVEDQDPKYARLLVYNVKTGKLIAPGYLLKLKQHYTHTEVSTDKDLPAGGTALEMVSMTHQRARTFDHSTKTTTVAVGGSHPQVIQSKATTGSCLRAVCVPCKEGDTCALYSKRSNVKRVDDAIGKKKAGFYVIFVTPAIVIGLHLLLQACAGKSYSNLE